MEHIEVWFRRNLDIVFLLYGASFVFMGVSILVHASNGSKLKFSRIIWILAAFALIHGINEWLDMMSFTHPTNTIFKSMGVFCLVTSFLFLFEFGVRLYGIEKDVSFFKWRITAGMLLFIFALSYASGQPWKTLPSLARYFLAFPGSLLTAIGFYHYRYNNEHAGKPLHINRYFVLSGTAFLAYAFLGGLVVSKGDFFPSNVLNNDTFISVVHVPVQVFRAISAALAAVSIVGVIKLFNWEKQKKDVDFQITASEISAMYLSPNSSIFDISFVINKQAMLLTKSVHGYVGEIDGKTKDLVVHTFTPMLDNATCKVEQSQQKIVFPKGKDGYNGLWGHSLNTKSGFYTNTPQTHPSYKNCVPDGHIPIRRFLSVPAQIKDRLIGQISLANAERDYTDEDLEIAQRLAFIYAIAMDRKRMEEDLRLIEERYRTILKTSIDGFSLVDKEGNFIQVNDAYCNMLGYNHKDFSQMRLSDIEASMSPEELKGHMRKVIEAGSARFETKNRRKDGSIVDIEISVNFLRSDNLLFAFLRDITERKNMEEELKLKSEDIARNYDMQNVVNRILKLSYKNLTIKEFLDLVLDVLFSFPCFAIKPVGCIFLCDDTASVLKMVAIKNFPTALLEPCKEIQTGRCICGLAASKRKLIYKDRIDSEHGIVYENMPEHGHYCVPIITQDRVLGVINVYVEAGHKQNKIEEQLLLMLADTLAAIIERKMTDEKLEYMANYDTLTGVPNRTLLYDRLTQSINQSKRYKDKTAVLYIDLDKFKAINDKHGHDAGDVVLKKASARFKRSVRDVDTVARLGGDEFAVVVRGFNKPDELTELRSRIIDEIDRPMEYKGKTLLVNASIGISVYPKDGSDGMLLLKKADTAMYNAKTSSGSNFLFYDDSMDGNLRERDKLEEDILYAITNNQFVLYYQPIIDLGTNKITSAEALIRWNHLIFGLIYPDRFISLAEEAGLGVEIDRWVIKTAIEQNILWHKQGLPLLNIAVNVTCNLLQQDDFADYVIRTLSDVQMDPKFFDVEITECLANQNIEQTTTVLTRLSKVGVKVSLDDFGAGYSSLIYLKRLPFNKIKLDKSFIMNITHDQDTLIIVKTIVDMAHNLRKTIIAKGIETQEQLELLTSIGCDEAQGYLFGKPLSAGDFMAFERDKVSS